MVPPREMECGGRVGPGYRPSLQPDGLSPSVNSSLVWLSSLLCFDLRCGGVQTAGCGLFAVKSDTVFFDGLDGMAPAWCSSLSWRSRCAYILYDDTIDGLLLSVTYTRATFLQMAFCHGDIRTQPYRGRGKPATSGQISPERPARKHPRCQAADVPVVLSNGGGRHSALDLEYCCQRSPQRCSLDPPRSLRRHRSLRRCQSHVHEHFHGRR